MVELKMHYWDPNLVSMLVRFDQLSVKRTPKAWLRMILSLNRNDKWGQSLSKKSTTITAQCYTLIADKHKVLPWLNCRWMIAETPKQKCVLVRVRKFVLHTPSSSTLTNDWRTKAAEEMFEVWTFWEVSRYFIAWYSRRSSQNVCNFSYVVWSGYDAGFRKNT